MAITKKQSETLRLIKLGYTVKGIANYCKISKRGVYKRLERLIQKGHLKRSVPFGGGTTPEKVRFPNRLHAQQFTVRILYSSALYRNLLKQSNIIIKKNYTCKLYKESIILWIKQDFISEDIKKAQKESMKFIEGVLLQLENRLGIRLLKEGYLNIKEVKSHFSETNNELAKDYNYKKKKLKIKGGDGKIWAHIDDSLNLNEFEFIHPEHSLSDAEKITDHFKFLRKNPRVLEVMARILIQQSKIIKTLDIEKNKKS